MSSTVDYSSPTAQFAFDINKSPLFKKNNQNFINILGIDQLNTLDNVSLLDIYLSKNNVIEPHYHQNAAQLVYCISGAITVSILNPYTKQLHHYPITPGQVANVPQGWWHYEVATSDNTHIIAIFNAPTPEVILGSDLLKLTPANIMAHTYCLDEEQWKKAIAPVKPATFIGPPVDCNKTNEHYPIQNSFNQYACQMYTSQAYSHQYAYCPHQYEHNKWMG
ncbi:cupin domain-containing protein [Sporosarcina jiandibaonis]|uniref:cupin domain-containing protein n=1 Tax=Sporosarcina jiandibaonis TaxID=2715535 RepID=UPI001554ABBA|nr:cupin domain-containing protein [Sporosarcina jiandibaonis]